MSEEKLNNLLVSLEKLGKGNNNLIYLLQEKQNNAVQELKNYIRNKNYDQISQIQEFEIDNIEQNLLQSLEIYENIIKKYQKLSSEKPIEIVQNVQKEKQDELVLVVPDVQQQASQQITPLQMSNNNKTDQQKLINKSTQNSPQKQLNIQSQLLESQKLTDSLDKQKLNGKQDDYIRKIIFSPAFLHIITACNDGLIRIYNSKTYLLEQTLSGHVGSVNGICISSDSNWIASGGEDKKIKIWNFNTFKCVMTKSGHYGPILSLQFNSNGTKLISSSEDDTVIEWCATTMVVEQIISFSSGHVNAIAVSPNGAKMVAADNQGQLSIFRAVDLKLIQKLKAHKQAVLDVCFSYDSQFLASAGLDLEVQIWAVNKNSDEIYPYGFLKHHVSQINCLSFQKKNNNLISGSEDGKLIVWSVESLELKKILSSNNQAITSVITNNQGFAINGCGDNSIQIWDIFNDYELIKTIERI